jgi:uncharacterized protein with HEPN domain
MFTDDDTRVKHILEAASEAISFAHGKVRKDLDTDRKLSLSLIRLLEVIGEAANGLSDGFRESHSDIPWDSIINMRNRLIHGYFDINLDVVWQTVTEDLQELIKSLS